MRRQALVFVLVAALGAAAAFAIAGPSHGAALGGTTTTPGPGRGQSTCTFTANSAGTSISVSCSKGISDYTVGTCAKAIDFSGNGQPKGDLQVGSYSGGNTATITDNGQVITQLYLKAADTRFVFTTGASCTHDTTSDHTTTDDHHGTTTDDHHGTTTDDHHGTTTDDHTTTATV